MHEIDDIAETHTVNQIAYRTADNQCQWQYHAPIAPRLLGQHYNAYG